MAEKVLKDGKWFAADPVRTSLVDRFIFFTYRLRLIFFTRKARTK